MSKAEREIVKVVRRTTLEVIQEVFSDPDRGLELTESIKRRLKKAASNTSYKGFMSLAAIRRKFN